MRFTRRNSLSLLAFWILVFLSSCSSQKTRFEEGLAPVVVLEKRAMSEYASKHYGKAVKLYRQILSIANENPSKYENEGAWAAYEIAFIHLVQKKFDQARDEFQVLLSKYPDILPLVTLSTDRLKEIDIRLAAKNRKKSKNFFPPQEEQPSSPQQSDESSDSPLDEFSKDTTGDVDSTPSDSEKISSQNALQGDLPKEKSPQEDSTQSTPSENGDPESKENP